MAAALSNFPLSSARLIRLPRPRPLEPVKCLGILRRAHLRRPIRAASGPGPEGPRPAGTSEQPAQKPEVPAGSSGTPENADLAALKEALQERREKQREDTLSGVLEEVQQIEWPVFGKVLGTTGVVLAVIAGSSLVLLTLNAVLTELSDRVFAGRGVQDFFG